MQGRFVTRIIAVAAAALVLMLPAAAQQQAGADRAAKIKEEAAKPTPRLADGHPDLSGNWSDPPNAPLEVVRSGDGKTLTVLDRDAPEIDARAQPNFKARAADNSRRPPYKPQFVAKQRELMYTASRIDPGIHCYPKGVPRLGPPTEIVHTPSTVYFFYAGEHTHRIIPIGGRHNPDQDPLPNGDSTAHWEGDTLVVDVVNFDSETWLSRDGDYHDDNMHVVERFTRKGTTLDYEVTVEDPTLFTAPWKPKAGFTIERTGSRTMILREDGVHDPPDYPCVERDREHKVNNDRF
ncbi:MAG: hypothetical protein DMG15_12365 [Acidobacteria bacterium]|nr:MAG: hypothetical protein DMG16_02480 [Acidobacteriota bacterium]PYS13007.1 MAG: hypothetical protein DMG15_12365 [Acidobacteriota bacterium]